MTVMTELHRIFTQYKGSESENTLLSTLTHTFSFIFAYSILYIFINAFLYACFQAFHLLFFCSLTLFWIEAREQASHVSFNAVSCLYFSFFIPLLFRYKDSLLV